MAQRLGSLTWEIKDSLLDYVAALPDAHISGTRITEAADSPFIFVETAQSSEDRPSYAGQIRITAYDGMMNIDLSDPVLTRDTQYWIMTFRTGDGSSLEVARLSAVAEEATGDLLVRKSHDVALSIDAAPLFGGSYAPYTRMAPVEFSSRLPEDGLGSD